MSNYKTALLSALFLANSAIYAAEPTQGWYAGFFGGVNYTPSLNFNFYTPNFNLINGGNSNLFLPNGLNQGRLQYQDIGGNAGFQIGFRCNYFRFEGEFLYNYSGYDKLRINGRTLPRSGRFNNFSMKGNTTLAGGLANAYYEFYEDGTDPTWVPYVGLGLGYTYMQNQLKYYYNDYNLNQYHNKISNSYAIGQAIVGINYFYSDDAAVGLDFRYATTGTLKHSNERFAVVALNVVFNYSFDEGMY